MKAKRDLLISHLRALHCGGLIPQAVLRGGFASSAVAADQTVLVDAGPADESLEDAFAEDPVGVMDLDRLISALDVARTDTVEIGVRDQRLVLTVGHTTVALVTAAPENIPTDVAQEHMERIREGAGVEGEGQPLDPEAVAAVLKTLRLLDARDNETRVAFVLGPENCGVKVGAGTADQGLTRLPDVSVSESEERAVSDAALKAVFELIGPEARIWFGDGGVTVVRDRDHSFYLTTLAEE